MDSTIPPTSDQTNINLAPRYDIFVFFYTILLNEIRAKGKQSLVNRFFPIYMQAACIRGIIYSTCPAISQQLTHNKCTVNFNLDQILFLLDQTEINIFSLPKGVDHILEKENNVQTVALED